MTAKICPKRYPFSDMGFARTHSVLTVLVPFQVPLYFNSKAANFYSPSPLLRHRLRICGVRARAHTHTHTHTSHITHTLSLPLSQTCYFNPYPTAFPYGNGMVLHFYQQQESSTTKTVHRVINRGLKAYV